MVTLIAPRKVVATATVSATLVRGAHTPVDATSGALTMTLPTNAAAGVEVSVEKVDSSTNAVSISGTIRGTVSTITLTSQFESRTFLSDGAGAWRPTSDHRTKTSLDKTYAAVRANRAPQNMAPLSVPVPINIDKTNTHAILGYNPATGVYYGSSLVNGHYETTLDGVTFTDRTYSPATYTVGLIGWSFDATYMYAYTSTGTIFRALLNDFNHWTEITVPDKGPLTTGRPGSLLAVGSGVLLYGNYTSGNGDGAHIWRSTNAGATWTHVLDIATAKHVHCIRQSDTTGYLWATIGDGGQVGIGQYRSTDAGLTWTYISSNDYGIDMVFVPALGDRPAMVVMEGDGGSRPHIMGLPEDAAPGDRTIPLVWFSGAPTDPLTTRGTTRGITLTPAGDLIYFTTAENGVVGTRSGIWIAQGPDFTRAVLLYETTGAEPVSYMRTRVIGTTVFNNQWTFTLPTFGSY